VCGGGGVCVRGRAETPSAALEELSLEGREKSEHKQRLGTGNKGKGFAPNAN